MAQLKLIGGQYGVATKEKLEAMFEELFDTVTGDGMKITAGLEIGSTPAQIASGAFTFQIAGVQYQKSAVAAGTDATSDAIPLGLFGAVALDISAAGTITWAEAADNDVGYATAELAVLALPAVASGKARMGWVTASMDDATFTFGTDTLADANATVAYTDAPLIGA